MQDSWSKPDLDVDDYIEEVMEDKASKEMMMKKLKMVKILFLIVMGDDYEENGLLMMEDVYEQSQGTAYTG